RLGMQQPEEQPELGDDEPHPDEAQPRPHPRQKRALGGKEHSRITVGHRPLLDDRDEMTPFVLSVPGSKGSRGALPSWAMRTRTRARARSCQNSVDATKPSGKIRSLVLCYP